MNILTIFLIHGLGGTTHSLRPLKAYLNFMEYKKVHLVSYPVQDVSLLDSIQHVSNEMIKVTDKKDEVIVIGQSLGGVICHELHEYGWNIKKSITIVSPHHGSSFLEFLSNIVPKNIAEYLHKPVYDDLLTQYAKIPAHPHYTISTSFFPCIPFDGQVWTSETKVSDHNHVHIDVNNHWTIFLDPRMFFTVNNIIQMREDRTKKIV